MNTMLNKILREQPQDPYAVLATLGQAESSSAVYLKDYKVYEILNSDLQPTITIDFTVNYLAKDIVINTDIAYLKNQETPLNVLLDEDANRLAGKGMAKAIQILEDIKPQLVSFALTN